jgi:hypothetical protein
MFPLALIEAITSVIGSLLPVATTVLKDVDPSSHTGIVVAKVLTDLESVFSGHVASARTALAEPPNTTAKP